LNINSYHSPLSMHEQPTDYLGLHACYFISVICMTSSYSVRLLLCSAICVFLIAHHTAALFDMHQLMSLLWNQLPKCCYQGA